MIDRFRDEPRRHLRIVEGSDAEERCFSEFSSQFLRRIFPSSMDHDLRAFARKDPHHALPDAGSRAGHQDHFVFQALAHGWSTPLTITPECISSNASCHSLSGEMRLSIGSRSILPLASSEMTFSQMGQL